MVYLVSGPPRPLVSRHVDADTNGKGKGKRKGKERVMQKEMEQGKEKVNGNEKGTDGEQSKRMDHYVKAIERRESAVHTLV